MRHTPLPGDNKLLSLLRSLSEPGEGTREAGATRPVERERTQTPPCRLFLVVSRCSATKSGSDRVKVIPL